MAIELIELYLSCHAVTIEDLRVLGRACLFLVSKYEEIYPPKLACFLRKLEDTCSKAHLLAYEAEILLMINFDMTRVVVLDFFSVFLVIAEFDAAVTNFGMFVLNLCGLESSFYNCSKALIAFGLCYFLHKLFKTGIFYDFKSGPEGLSYTLVINKGRFDPKKLLEINRTRLDQETLGSLNDSFVLSFKQRDVKIVSEGIYALTQRFREAEVPNLFAKFQDEKKGCFSATDRQ